MMRTSSWLAGLAALGLLGSTSALALDERYAAGAPVFEGAAGPLAGQSQHQAFAGDGTLFGYPVVPQTCEQSETTSKVVGGVVGAVVGGLLGSTIGGGSGKTVATIAGTGLGVILGSTAGGYIAGRNPDCQAPTAAGVYSQNPAGGGPLYNRSAEPRDLFGYQDTGWLDPDRAAAR